MSNHGGARQGSGRKPKADDDRKVRVTVFLSPKQVQALIAIVGTKRGALSGAIASIVEKYLKGLP